jgi:hypothetical protein
MSSSSQEVTWDRRRADRRTELIGTDRRRAESSVGRYEAYLDLRLGALESTAAVTAGDISEEAFRLRNEPESDVLDGERVDGLADRMSRAIEAIAEEISRLREEFRGSGDDALSESALSEGAELLVRQMAVSGADATEIERELASLGMEHPREAIEAVLAEPQ